MSSTRENVRPHPHGLGDVISDKTVRGLFDRMRDDLSNIHANVAIVESAVDLRAEFGERVICRVVPYRELLHVHVGSDPTWEARIRSEASYAEVLERVVGVFLRCYATPTGDNSLS